MLPHILANMGPEAGKATPRVKFLVSLKQGVATNRTGVNLFFISVFLLYTELVAYAHDKIGLRENNWSRAMIPSY